MRWEISPRVPPNSAEYFEKALIAENGFREYDLRWLMGKEVNPNGFLILGKAYGTYLQKVLQETRVVVGHDFRSYSQELCRSLVVGLLSTGATVIDLGLVLTPMVYFAQHRFGTRAGAMVTASHNENGWTGLKLADGLSSTMKPEGILQLKELVRRGDFRAAAGSYEAPEGFLATYKEDLKGRAAFGRRLRVVVAAGNGTAGRFAPEILRELGCEVHELDCNLDWTFPKHNPNPEDVSFLHGIAEETRRRKADLGIGLDGDGDRIGVIDDSGEEVFSDKIGLLLARWLCPRSPGRSVVIDVKSTGLFSSDPVLAETGTKVVTWKTGHSYIKTKVAEVDAFAGFEKSGHWFFNRPFGRCYDDGILSAVWLLNFLGEAGKPLSRLVAELPRSWQSPTIGARCPDDAKYDVVRGVTAQYEEDRRSGTPIAGRKIREITTVNGVRFVLDDGSWGLLRASSNKPSLVLVAESFASKEQLREIVEHIQRRIEATGKVGEYDQQL